MGSKIKFDFRKWLTKNKIFIELFSGLSLIYIAYQANLISQNSIEIQEKNIEAYFQVYKTKDDKLMIDHLSGYYEDLDITLISGLEYSYGAANKFSMLEEATIISDFKYFPVAYLPHEISPGLTTKNDSSLNRLEECMRIYLKNEYNGGILSLDPSNFLTLSYTNFKGERKNLYYDVTKTPVFTRKSRIYEHLESEYWLIDLEDITEKDLQILIDPYDEFEF